MAFQRRHARGKINRARVIWLPKSARGRGPDTAWTSLCDQLGHKIDLSHEARMSDEPRQMGYKVTNPNRYTKGPETNHVIDMAVKI